MLISAISRNKYQSGFTLIELMVVLVLAGLVISVAAPSMMSWLNSRERASQIATIKGAMALLPLHSRLRGEWQEITSLSELDLDVDASVTTPIVVSASGYCQQGELAVGSTSPRHYRVSSPLCELEQVDAQ